MTGRTAIDGNLALVLDDAPAFTVIDGGAMRVPESRASRVQAPRTARVWIVGVLSVAAIAVCVWLASLVASQHAYDAALASAPRTQMTVSSGDTLWSIADEHGIEGLSTQDTVQILRQWNGLSQSSLNPGMTLEVPA